MLGLQEMDSGGAILSVGSTTGCWILVFRTKLLLSPLLPLQTALQPINVISDATDALYPALSFFNACAWTAREATLLNITYSNWK